MKVSTTIRGQLLGLLGGLALIAAAVAVPAYAATNAAATLDQCTNGPVGPPIQAEPCVGSNIAAVSVAITGINGGASTSYKNWVNGNANGSKAHWREGEFISYRTIITGLGGGSHSLTFSYDTVHSGRHALDYVGSFDFTETTATDPTYFGLTLIHANNNSPCSDLVAAGMMTAAQCQAAPTTVAAPSEKFTGTGGEQGCGNSPGTWSGSQVSGTIDFFSPVTVSNTGATITSDNVPSGTGTCTSTVTVTWDSSALTGGKAMVIAWGGHIASQGDWGSGNSASFISGSPFHMSLSTLDGASTGSQDRALATSAIYFTPSVSTLLVPNTSISVGASVYDTATLSGESANAGGTLTYKIYSDSTCSTLATTGTGNMISAQPGTVTVTNGAVPNSSSVTFQKSGTYYWVATYSGDGVNIGPDSSTCGSEITVVKAQPSATSTPSVVVIPDDSATISGGTTSPAVGGTLHFYLYGPNDTTCASSSIWDQSVTVNGNGTYSTTNKTATTPFTVSTAGTYSWKIVYSGDTNNSGFTIACNDENFTVSLKSKT